MVKQTSVLTMQKHTKVITMNDSKVYILLDSDSLYFRVCCVTKDKKEIREHIDIKLGHIARDVTNDTPFEFCEPEYRIAIKGKGNYRDDLFPGYKGHRKELEEDMKEALAYSINYMIEHHNAIPADGMEADDLVSIWAAECRGKGENYIVCHIDKDLDMIPGYHYNFVKETSYYLDEDEAYYKYSMQKLTGDKADGIRGIEGIGPAKAEKLLREGYGDRDKLDKIITDVWKAEYKGDLPWYEALDKDAILLRMLESWSELYEIQQRIQIEAVERQHDVEQERQEDIQDEGVSGLSGDNTHVTDGNDMAVWEESDSSEGGSGTF